MKAISTPRALRRFAAVVLVAAVGLLGACADSTELASLDAPPPDSTPPDGPIDRGDTSTTSNSVPVTTPPATTAPPETTTTAPPATPPTTVPPETPDSFERGDDDPGVAALQSRLQDLGFYLPAVDGMFGSITEQAVLAFQKAAGLGRDGVAGPNTVGALESATPIGPREGGDHIEIDLSRQLMFLVKGDQTFIFNTSTGTSGMETPPGRFTITREIDGMRHAPLGQLWRPKYFNGGIALHGSNSIPGHAASHGCARLHNQVIDMIWDTGLAPIGTPVWVY